MSDEEPSGRVYGSPPDETLVMRSGTESRRGWACCDFPHDPMVACVPPPPVVSAPVMDVPAEDGGGSGSWAFTPGTVFEHYNGESSSSPATRAADALRRGDVVVGGPWPVRQYFWGPGDLTLAVHDLLEGLALAGTAFYMEAWWVNAETQVVRVQWGAFLASSAAEIEAAVESWPE